MVSVERERLRTITTNDAFVEYLRDNLEWPNLESDLSGLTYSYDSEELGIDSSNAAKIESIKQLKPLVANQPWGIFLVEFESKRLPIAALRRIMSSLALKKRLSDNAVERAAWEIDDLLFISNYGEGSERQISLFHFSPGHSDNRLPSLKELGWDKQDTGLRLDYVATQLSENLYWPNDHIDLSEWRSRWRSAFTVGHREAITTSKILAIRLAEVAVNIRGRIKSILKVETKDGPITQLMKGVREALVHDVDADGFADMYAQTIVYGLLFAKITNPKTWTSNYFEEHAFDSNPFLKNIMQSFMAIAGVRDSIEATVRLDFDELGLDSVVEVLETVQLDEIVRDFGNQNRREDPVIHFYEEFLTAYDKDLKIDRGVFYTPKPVVSFIVRNVHEQLKNDFALDDGLAATDSWADVINRFPGLALPSGVDPSQMFVQILDPATGTGTFLAEVIDVIYDTMMARWKSAGCDANSVQDSWIEYVDQYLLPRLHGYELLMAPYVVAHLKISLKLYETGYRFGRGERIRIYLTNALEPAPEVGERAFEGLLPALAHEAEAVSFIKRNQHFTVIIGNPPYSDSATNNQWIDDLIKSYKEGLDEQKSDLNREEWKFLRLAREVAGAHVPHICGFVINNAFLRAITHKLMRKDLLSNYQRVTVVNLHGSLRPPESVPHAVQKEYSIGPQDQNVFKILQGVTVLMLATQPAFAGVYYADEWGLSERKLTRLSTLGIQEINFQNLTPDSPNYFLVERDDRFDSEFTSWPSLKDLFVSATSGIQTGRDSFASTLTQDQMDERVDAIRSGSNWSAVAPGIDIPEWSGFSLDAMAANPQLGDAVVDWMITPFDVRPLLYHPKAIKRMRQPIMEAMGAGNLGLCTVRQIYAGPWRHVFVSRHRVSDTCVSNKSREYPYVFPSGQVNDGTLFDQLDNLSDRGRELAHENLQATADQAANVLVYYIYGILHSPSYRSRYGEQLLIDFPRIPIASSWGLTRELIGIGQELTSLHLLESDKLGTASTTLVGAGDFQVDKVSYSDETVWLNKSRTIGFHGVPREVWDFHIGGYRVCEKWLKDRGPKKGNPGSVLTQENLEHYQKMVASLKLTTTFMEKIDIAIEQYGGWPAAFRVD